MNVILEFRAVTVNDLKMLFIWRNDPETRKYSHNTHEITIEEHAKWFSNTLKNKRRRLMIAEHNGLPVGFVRDDYVGEIHELSWNVAPNARGKGIGKMMVKLIVDQIKGPISAEVKKYNEGSKKIAVFAGMKIKYEKNGILYYHRNEME